MADKTYIGKGKVYIKEEGATAALAEMGNCTALALSITEDVKKALNYQTAGGGTLNEVRRIESVVLSMTLQELSRENLARALLGSESAVTGDTVTDEAITGYVGQLARLAHPNPTSVTVTGTGGTPTYVAGTDYEVRAGGIYVLSGGSISNGTALLVDYTYATYDKVEALVNSNKVYQLFFEGLNEAQSGKAALVDLWRVRLGASEQLALLGDEFAELTVSGEVIADSTKAAGTSQYFREQLEQ